MRLVLGVSLEKGDDFDGEEDEEVVERHERDADVHADQAAKIADELHELVLGLVFANDSLRNPVTNRDDGRVLSASFEVVASVGARRLHQHLRRPLTLLNGQLVVVGAVLIAIIT